MFQNNSGEHKGNWLTAFPGLLNHYCEKGHAFWGTLSLGLRYTSTIMPQKANAILWNGNIWHWQSKGGSKNDVGTLLCCTGANFETLPREQHNSKQCPLMVKCSGASWYQLSEPNAEGCYQEWHIVAQYYPSAHCCKPTGAELHLETFST
jgi:hypothetical protein